MTFAMPETGIGLFPDVGGSYFLPRCPGADRHVSRADRRTAEDSDTLYAGIATHFVPMAKWEALIASLRTAKPPDKACIAMGEAVPRTFLAEHRAAIDRIFAAQPVEDILSASMPSTKIGRDDTAKTIRTKSPTSLKVAFRQIREGAKLEFDDCMRMEFRMVNRIVAGHDFYEGVRATIIDKDGAPKWHPAELADVSDADVAAYFAPLGDKELEAMTTIAFIGVGNMGGPMARNLLKAGHKVTAFDLSAAALEPVIDAGGEEARERASRLSKVADVVITMLPAGQHVRSVLSRERRRPGSGAKKDALLIDCSTIDIDSARAVHERRRESGLRFSRCAGLGRRRRRRRRAR